jgi:hypothetical protein
MDQSVESTRSAKDIIDQTINDNKASEWLLYGYATLFVFAGTTALIWGMVVGEYSNSIARSAFINRRNIRSCCRGAS